MLARTGHRCLELRKPDTGKRYPREFHRQRKKLVVATHGRLTVNDPSALLSACSAGSGVAQMLLPGAAHLKSEGRLIDLFPDWPDERFPPTHITHRGIMCLRGQEFSRFHRCTDKRRLVTCIEQSSTFCNTGSRLLPLRRPEQAGGLISAQLSNPKFAGQHQSVLILLGRTLPPRGCWKLYQGNSAKACSWCVRDGEHHWKYKHL